MAVEIFIVFETCFEMCNSRASERKVGNTERKGERERRAQRAKEKLERIHGERVLAARDISKHLTSMAIHLFYLP